MAAHQLYFHLTWSTLGRRPMIDAPTRDYLDAFLRRTAIREGAEIIEVAMLQTHVHLLIRTATRFDLSRLVQAMKGGSSYSVNRTAGNVVGLRWNRQYSVTSVSPRALGRVIAYLRGQDRRHPGETVE